MEVIIETIIKRLEQDFKTKRNNPIKDHSEGDIDFFVQNKTLEEISLYLKTKGFIVKTDFENDKVAAYIFAEEKLYFLDIKVSHKQILKLFKPITFKDIFFSDTCKDKNLEKFFRYSLEFRNKKQMYIKFIEENYTKYYNYLSNTTYLSRPIFRKNISSKLFLKTIQRHPIAIIKALKFIPLMFLILNIFQRKIKKLNSGKIVAFVGADGSGKTSAINEFSKIFDVRIVHMGDGSVWFKHLFSKLYKMPVYISRLTYFIIYTEHWWRYFKMRIWKLQGKTVFADRWPGMNRHLRKNNSLLVINSAIYKFLPDPDLFIFLSAPPEIIYERKQDITIPEITAIQENLHKKLERKKYVHVETKEFTQANNLIFKSIIQLS